MTTWRSESSTSPRARRSFPNRSSRRRERDLWNIDGSGIGILEHSHRGATFKRVIAEAEADCRQLAGIPDDYAVLFLQGGASTQFYMLPANFLPADGTADYLITGSWSKKAMKEAKHYGEVHVACSSEDANFSYIPEESADPLLRGAGLRALHLEQHHLRDPVPHASRHLRVTPGSPATPPATSSRGRSAWSATA